MKNIFTAGLELRCEAQFQNLNEEKIRARIKEEKYAVSI